MYFKTYDFKGCCIILPGASIKRNPYEWIAKKLIWLWKVINPTHLTNDYPRATKRYKKLELAVIAKRFI